MAKASSHKNLMRIHLNTYAEIKLLIHVYSRFLYNRQINLVTLGYGSAFAHMDNFIKKSSIS
jgi:hypothetical protein